MSSSRRNLARASLLTVPLLLAASVILPVTFAQQAPAPAVEAKGGDFFDAAGKVTRLVRNGRIDELSKLNLSSNLPDMAKLKSWTDTYVAEMQQQDQQRDKQYKETVGKAQDQLKLDHYDKAMAYIVTAYRIAKDPAAFLALDWVKDFTAKVAARAGDLEKQGNWIESLQLFTDLNTLYEIDTRYKSDMQRLARRTRLLAVYTPKILVDMRDKLIDQEKDPTETQPATKPAAEEEPTFTRWQDMAEKITLDQATDALDRSVADWVEKTSYDQMVRGGSEALRLFLTTPEMQKEFAGLKDDAARKSFGEALDNAIDLASNPNFGSDDLQKVMQGLIDKSAATIKLPKEVVIMEFTDGAMEKLDPFTAVIWPHEVDEFEKNTTGAFGGVGIQIALENGVLKVISPLEDTPAYKAGIQAGDIVTSIDGKTTVGISVDTAVHSIMGDPGKPVTLRIKRGTDPDKDYVITRAVIKVASVKGWERLPTDETKWDYMIDKDNKIGYIRITGFQAETADELRAALDTLKKQGMQGVVLDLRFNPGGLLNAAIDMSDMFLTDGTIVSTRGRTVHARPQQWDAHLSTEIPPTMPMIVMVNEYSASASEIFSGAMKDLSRAMIVGHRSFGKGSVQNLIKIGTDSKPNGDPLAMMKLTMAYYYLPNGESLHRRDGAKSWGVDPDVAVDLTPDQLSDLLTTRRDADVIHGANEPKPAATTSQKAPTPDTQLDTAMLMMRLQLVTGGADKTGVAGK